MYINLEGGKKAAMPRYYKDRIYTLEERSLVGGYQKGEMEKRFYKNVEEVEEYGKYYSEAVAAAFRKVESQSVKTKI